MVSIREVQRAKEEEIAKRKAAGKQRAAYSWTQPVCSECWDGLKLKTGRPAHDHSTAYTCCYCKQPLDGDRRFMIRINPGAVPYPTLLKDQDESA